MKKLGLYIHIPFCESKCDYCNFVSFKVDEQIKEKYVEYLIKEIELSKDKYTSCEIDTIYIGGGTPSCLREKSIKNILNFVENNFNVNIDAEITVEANPNSLTIEKLREFKLAGVNRLSVGLQAYNDKLLRLIGRVHTKKQFDKAIADAKKIGFENISVDILLGLPKQKLFDIKQQLHHLIKLKIPHISAYGLIVEQNTKLLKNLETNVYKLPTEDKSVKMYDFVLKKLEKSGISRYEVSNFAKKGFESKHNLKYWTMQEYVGFGLSSHSFFDGFRWENTANLEKYFECLDNNNLPIENEQHQSITDLKEEYIMTSLRKADGFSLQQYNKFFEEDIVETKNKEINKFIKCGMLKINEDRIMATNKGFEFLNQIIIELI